MNKVLELQKKYLEEIDKYSHIKNRDEDINHSFIQSFIHL